MTKIYNRSSERLHRKQLRNNMPSAEVIVWSRLQRRQLDGWKFRRQFSIGSYIVDFYCAELKLAIEVDGESHFRERARVDDEHRQASIEHHGVKFLRFANPDVYKNLRGVLEAISETAREMKNKKAFPAMRPPASKSRTRPP